MNSNNAQRGKKTDINQDPGLYFMGKLFDTDTKADNEEEKIMNDFARISPVGVSRVPIHDAILYRPWESIRLVGVGVLESEYSGILL